ncbi:MAG: diaminopimelate decarboxylase [Firmicutes bacterium]|nr:diaminopimelate decarboxylase [Bacillota bacterium]
MLQIMNEEGLGLDVVSGGELFTALSIGYDVNKIYFHGSNKTQREIAQGVKAGIHAFVVDNFDEIEMIDVVAKSLGIKQKVLLRINIGVDADTHKHIQTANVDSKFGLGLDDGQAYEAIVQILTSTNLDFIGLHCHVGSQLFELTPFIEATKKMCQVAADIKKNFDVEIEELNVGGGFGVRYVDGHKPHTIGEYILAIVETLNKIVEKSKIKPPKLIIEPGRRIIAQAGTTLYTVGAIKDLKRKKYISVDGGMFENPRYALYEAKYDAAIANRLNSSTNEKVTIAGKCCESGDMVIGQVMIAEAKRGDILAVFTTGAYNYSMASNYNRNLVPGTVLINGKESRYIVKPQTYEDLIRNDF